MTRQHHLRAAVISVALVLGFSAAASAVLVHSKSSAPSYYLSLGDSYAQGFQPGFLDNSESLYGFSDQLVTKLASSGHALTLRNFGCGGTTSSSIFNAIGCRNVALQGVAYPTTSQATAALAFIDSHPGQVGLVTISLGLNDFVRCRTLSVTCVEAAMTNLKTNVSHLSSQLRAALGSKVPIIALTYPDVFLGEWLRGDRGKTVAVRSLTTFKKIVNPTLASAYSPASVAFVDVTAASGAYVDLTHLTTNAVYGVIPYSVSAVCDRTWACELGDVHPRTNGYGYIAGLVKQAYLKILKASS